MILPDLKVDLIEGLFYFPFLYKFLVLNSKDSCSLKFRLLFTILPTKIKQKKNKYL